MAEPLAAFLERLAEEGRVVPFELAQRHRREQHVANPPAPVEQIPELIAPPPEPWLEEAPPPLLPPPPPPNPPPAAAPRSLAPGVPADPWLMYGSFNTVPPSGSVLQYQDAITGTEWVLGAPIVILATGQSNFFFSQPYAWTPNPRVKVWNWANNPDVPGTAFAAVDPTRAAASWAFASRIADAFPGSPVYVVNLAWSSMSISHWIGGTDYVWDNGTTAADPGGGKLRQNNASATGTTALYINEFDVWGLNTVQQLQTLALPAKARLSQADNPAIYAEFTVSHTAVDNGTYQTLAVTYLSAASWPPAAGTPIKLSLTPDMWDIIGDNVPPALAAAGVGKIDYMIWWQGEADAGDLGRYREDYDLLTANLKQQAWFPPTTPIVIFGIASQATMISDTAPLGLASYRFMNTVLQQVAADDPEVRMFVYHNLEGIAYWSSPPHMSGLGYYTYGTTAAQALLGGTGRNTMLPVDPETGTMRSEAALVVSGSDPYTPGTGIWLDIRQTGTVTALIRMQGENIVESRLERYGDNANAVRDVARSARGTIAVPAVAAQNDFGRLLADQFWDGTTFRDVVVVRSLVIAPTPGPTDMQSRWQVQVCPAGSVTPTSVLTIEYDAGLEMYGHPVIGLNRDIRVGPFTIATLPPPFAGSLAWCSDLGGGAGMLTSDASFWRRVGSSGFQTLGDADKTLTVLTDAEIVYQNATLTANRTITLSTTRAYVGATFNISRIGAGAFTLDVGGLKTLAANTWCTVRYTASSWILSQYGAL